PHSPDGIGEALPQSPPRNVPNFNDALHGTAGQTASVPGETPGESAPVRDRPGLQERLGKLEVGTLPTGGAAVVIEGDDGFAVGFKGPGQGRIADINAGPS